MSQPIFYGVKVGRHPGVYFGFADCNAQVKGYEGAVWRTFNSFESAQKFCFPDGVPGDIKPGDSTESSSQSPNCSSNNLNTAVSDGTKANPICLDDTPIAISSHPYQKSPDHKYNISKYLNTSMEKAFRGKTYTKMRAMLGLSSTLCTDSGDSDIKEEQTEPSSDDKPVYPLPEINRSVECLNISTSLKEEQPGPSSDTKSVYFLPEIKRSVECINISTDHKPESKNIKLPHVPTLDFVSLTSDNADMPKRKRRCSKKSSIKSEDCGSNTCPNPVTPPLGNTEDSSSDDDDIITFIENPKKEIQMNQSKSEEFYRVGSTEQEVAVGVFWDIENVRMPRSMNPALLISKIREKYIDVSSLYCEKHFYVVCDALDESPAVMKQLFEFHVRIIHVPRLKANSSDNVLRDLMNEFVGYNKFSRIILISGDSDFSHDIHNFRRNKKCECILIHNTSAKDSLIKSATTAINFSVLLNDEIADHMKNNPLQHQNDPKRSRYNSYQRQQQYWNNQQYGNNKQYGYQQQYTNQQHYINQHQFGNQQQSRNKNLRLKKKKKVRTKKDVKYLNRMNNPNKIHDNVLTPETSESTADPDKTITNDNATLIDSALDDPLPDFIPIYGHPGSEDRKRQAYYRMKKKQMLTPRSQARKQKNT